MPMEPNWMNLSWQHMKRYWYHFHHDCDRSALNFLDCVYELHLIIPRMQPCCTEIEASIPTHPWPKYRYRQSLGSDGLLAGWCMARVTTDLQHFWCKFGGAAFDFFNSVKELLRFTCNHLYVAADGSKHRTVVNPKNNRWINSFSCYCFSNIRACARSTTGLKRLPWQSVCRWPCPF